MVYISLLEQNTIKKKQLNKNVAKLNFGDNNKKYQIKAI